MARTFTVTATVLRAPTPARVVLEVQVAIHRGAATDGHRGEVTLVGGCAIDTRGPGDLHAVLAPGVLPHSEADTLRARIRAAVLQACIPLVGTTFTLVPSEPRP